MATRRVDRVQELAAAGTVVSVLMTGAFILQQFGIPPILQTSYIFFVGEMPPIYFELAMGAAGVFAVTYQLLYATMISPLACQYGVDAGPTLLDLDKIEITDWLAIPLMYAMYLYILWTAGITNDGAFVGGAFVIATSLVFRIVPRVVAMEMKPDCLFSVKVVLISIPATILLFLPTIFVISALG